MRECLLKHSTSLKAIGSSESIKEMQELWFCHAANAEKMARVVEQELSSSDFITEDLKEIKDFLILPIKVIAFASCKLV